MGIFPEAQRLPDRKQAELTTPRAVEPLREMDHVRHTRSGSFICCKKNFIELYLSKQKIVSSKKTPLKQQ